MVRIQLQTTHIAGGQLSKTCYIHNLLLRMFHRMILVYIFLALSPHSSWKNCWFQDRDPTKTCWQVLAPMVANLANISFTEGVFPTRYKKAQVTPLLKKDGMDLESVSRYRPVSNLNTISKILEKLFMARLKPQISRSNYFHNIFPSAYRRYPRTETALLKILDDVHFSIDATRKQRVLPPWTYWLLLILLITKPWFVVWGQVSA